MPNSSHTVRKPAVAGLFYPDDPTELKKMIAEFLATASSASATSATTSSTTTHSTTNGTAGDSPEQQPKAIIVPHAGYVYSGPIAATAYARLLPFRDDIQHVILLGPSHRVPFSGLALTHADYYSTPLGHVAIDKEANAKICKVKNVVYLDDAHRQEHSLEVHLPFLQVIFAQFKLVPIVVGDTQAEVVSDVLELLWGGAETLIVISSDLSHYHDYTTAMALDSATSTAIENLQFEKIEHEHACGRNPISGLLHLSKQRGLRGETIDLRNSGDTAGTHDRVVGYGAYVFK